MNKIKILLSSILVALFIVGGVRSSYGGGYHIKGKITDIQILGNDQYMVSIVLDQEQPRGKHSFIEYTKPVVLHIRYNKNFIPIHPKEQYIKALNIMLSHFSKADEFELAFGYKPHSIKEGENQFNCDGLNIHNNHVMALKWSDKLNEYIKK